MNIHGKRVLVTGAAPEIDLALAQTLTRKGARPVLSGPRLGSLAAAVAELGACGSEACALSADIATGAGRGAHRAILTAARNQPGGLDVLVNNAGGVRAGSTTLDRVKYLVDKRYATGSGV
jgi:uncharacterized oxidoreductase